MKFVFITVAVFFFIHALRDYLQNKGIKNRFTEMGHIWDNPRYEIHSMIVSIILGLFFLYLGIYYG